MTHLAFERIVNTPKRRPRRARRVGDHPRRMARAPMGPSALWTGREALRPKVVRSAARAAKELRTLPSEGICPLALDDGRRGRKVQAVMTSDQEDMGAGDTPFPTVELAEVILDESGYTAHWQNDKTPRGARAGLENLKELGQGRSRGGGEGFENLRGFLETWSRSSWTTSETVVRSPRWHADDAARRQGAGVSRRLPAGLGRRRVVPVPAREEWTEWRVWLD